MAPRPPSENFKQIPVLAFSEWSSVPAVKQALSAAEFGLFKDAAMLVEAMGRDDRIEGVRATRLGALNGLPLEWTPADESQKALDVAADVEKLFGKMVPEALGLSHRGWGLDIGIGVAELLWEDYGTKMWVPSIRVWNPQWVYWRWDTWTYWLTTADSQPIELFSGKEGGYKWFLYCPFGSERGWMHSMVRSLAVPWLIRQWDWRDWARYSEVHGSPIKAGIVPANAEEAHKQRFIKEMSQLGHEMTIRLEQAAGQDGPKFDMKLIEAQANTWEGFEKLMAQANTAIAVRMLGQNLTTEIGGGSGSRAAAQVHDRVRSDFLRSDASTYAEAFKEQVLEPFCLFNYGSRQLAPTPKWKTDPPEDTKGHGETLNTVSLALLSLLKAGVPVDVLQFAKRFNIPLIEGASVAAPQLSDADQPTTAPDGQDGASAGAMTQKAGRRTRLKPHVEGQLFVDHVGDIGVEAAKRALAPDLADLLKVVKSATSYQDLRAKLLKAYGKMDPSRFARLMDKCLVLADHAGRHSVLEDL